MIYDGLRAKFKLLYDKKKTQDAKQTLYTAFMLLATKANQLNQDSFLIELIKFENDFLKED